MLGNVDKMKQFDGMLEDFCDRKKYCQSLYDKMKNVYISIANEFIVCDKDNALCGTIDMLAYNKKTNKYAIIDWKTSKEFATTSFDSSKMTGVFAEYDDCNVNHYSLQLSTYAWILEKYTSIKIEEMTLFQIPNKNSMPVIATCNDMKCILSKILH